MRNYLISTILCIIVFILFSCKEENQPPTCEITTPANAAEYSVGDNVTISADAEDSDGSISEVRFYVNGTGVGSASSFPYSYIWNTGAEDAGLYILKATSYDDENASASDEVVIELVEVIESPVADFTATPATGDAPLEVSFTDASTNEPESWSWEFGDGESSTVQNPMHTYTSQGQYTVMLTVSNANGSDNETKINYISVTLGVCPPTVTDFDGNIYNTVLIDTQCWMKENLEVTHYPNGDPIPYVAYNDQWADLADNNTDDAYCYYDNNTSSEYGALYTYAAAIADNWQRDNASDQGICPSGWHLPTDQEWTDLEEYLIANGFNWDGSTSGNKIGKSLASTYGWNNSSQHGEVGNDQASNNTTGFTALPGGYRSYNSGAFGNAGYGGYWWSATESSSSSAWNRGLGYNGADVYRYGYNKSYGFSVRCIQDN